jgi:trimeric autotransporter adhesin
MSTKTTFKRVALVAVASLGFGVLTSVAPANAAASDVTAIAAGTSAPARTGVFGGETTLTLTSGTTVETSVTVTAQITASPALSSAAGLDFVPKSSGNFVTITSETATATTAGVASAAFLLKTTATETIGLQLKADIAGTYQVLVTVDGNTSTGYSAGKVSTNYSITTTGAPTALTLTSVGGKVVTDTTAIDDPNVGGQLFALSMKDANGNATVLGTNEGVSISDNSDATTSLRALTGGGEISSFGPSQDVAGVYYVRVVGGTVVAGTGILTVTGAGLLPATLTTNASYTKVVVTDPSGVVAASVTCTTTTLCLTGAALSPAATWKVSGAAALTIANVLGLDSDVDTTDVIHPVQVTTSAGVVYTDVVTIAAASTAAVKATFTAPGVSSTLTRSAVKFYSTNAAGNVTVSFAYEAPSATAGSIAVQGAVKTILSATAAKNTFTVLVKDQYGVKIANAPVTVSVSGRNTVATTALGVTNADGLISYTVTDAGTTGTRDTVLFTGGGSTDTATINYGTVTVSTVTVTGGSTAETIAGAIKFNINAADNGPEASYKEIKAVVKDANGNLLAGVPVVFTVDSGAIVKTAAIDYATVYTGTDGSATTRAFGWTVSKQTVTATAGGVAKSGHINWVAEDATSARVLSATATGDIVSFKVVDRFGNAVKGVDIDLSRTGTGLFGSGKSTDSATTDKNGTADIRFIGSGTVVAELAATYAQAYDKAGEIAETAVTAAVAGTTKGTGATLAPAGVAKVSIAIAEGSDPVAVSSQAAADAAAEATDAANAATDAANAAAEAADAATAAAQDAADAVAALSTQVSEMVSALKKQITALTNLVIKIQKKVNA